MNTTPPTECFYEDEIDLRALALALWQGKWVILLATLAAALAALVVSLAMPKQYQAEARVVLTQPKLQFLPPEGFSLQVTVPDLKTAAAVAQAPELFQRLVKDAEVQAAWRQGGQPLTWQALAGRAAVKEQGKTGLQLLFKDTDPQRAALVANRWAALVVERINERYGWAGLRAQLEPQIQKTWRAYQDARAAYLQALSKNQAPVLEVQLARAKADLTCVLDRASQLARLQRDLAAFAEYLGGLPSEALLTPGDVLALTTLQQRILAPKVCVSDTASVQTQWSVEALTGATVEQAEALLQELKEVMRQRGQALPEQQKTLEDEVVRLQQALEEERAHLQEAHQQRDAAWQSYQALAALRSQEQVLNLPENQVALLAAQAVIPEAPVSPRMLMNVALAGVLGAMLGVMGVWLAAWWQEKSSEETAPV